MQPQEPMQPRVPVQPGPQPQAGDYPGKTLGIVGLVLAFLFPLIGLIISIIAKKQSKKAGYANTLAKVGIILGAIFTGLTLIFGTIMIIVFASLMAKCNELGPGVHMVGGTTYTCGGTSSDNTY